MQKLKDIARLGDILFYIDSANQKTYLKQKEKKLKFEVTVDLGDVYINGVFVSQLCWDAYSVGAAVTRWIEEQEEGQEETT